MGPTSRFFLFCAILTIGAVVGGRMIFTHLAWDQSLLQVRTDSPATNAVTAELESSVIPITQRGGVWVAQVEFNDLYEAHLIIDTGATFTTISNDLAFDAGIQEDLDSPAITLFTAGGKVQAEMGLARRMRVGNAGRKNVRVVVHTIPDLPEGIDGLLGLSFFDRFLVRLDQTNQLLYLSPKS